jgi:Rod binding domain-containing protein
VNFEVLRVERTNMEINPALSTTIKPIKPAIPTHADDLLAAREAQKAFQDFVGQTFFGQMLKSMRSTQGKPAYFHGGQAEEIFRSQLDQTMAEQMSNASADQFADPMFKRQFPKEAHVLAMADKKESKQLQMIDLNQLRRH